MATMSSRIPYGVFSYKHKKYINDALQCKMSVAEGSIRSGKTIDNCLIFAMYLETAPDKFHLASGSTLANAKMNVGVCNGFGLEALFRGRCRWGKYKDNECLYIYTKTGEKIVIFAGGGLVNSYKKILGYSFGGWIATEINEHYDSDDSRESFISVAFGRQVAAIKPFVLWDLNPNRPDHSIYTKYIDKFKTSYLGGYNYQHFTLMDNANLTEQRIEEIKAQYTIGSVWYRRDILGERCNPEGLIFQYLADHIQDYLIDDIPEDFRIQDLIVGLDFGGNGSKHALVSIAIEEDWKSILVLESKRPEAKGTSAIDLERMVNEFVIRQSNIFLLNKKKFHPAWSRDAVGGTVILRCDSAEQVLINGIKNSIASHQIPCIVKNAIKGIINDRIALTAKLIATHRIKFIKSTTDSVINALTSCVYDKKQTTKDVRLDDGTTDIDSCDAFEYTLEKDSKNLLRAMESIR